MLFHNHPSGEVMPSQTDFATTQKMMMAGKLNNIEILDHVIVSGDAFHSMAENGELELSSSEYLAGLRTLREMPLDEFNERYAFLGDKNQNNQFTI